MSQSESDVTCDMKLAAMYHEDSGPPADAAAVTPVSVAEAPTPDLWQLQATCSVPPDTVLQVMHCSVPAGHKSELVVDPGPGVLLVVSGSGKAMVRAGAVSDELVLDETDLHPGGEGGGSLLHCWRMHACLSA